MSEEETFWQATWRWLKKISRTIFAPGVAILIVVGAGLLIVLGFKPQIGGLLGKLFGRDRKSAKRAIDIANSIPEGRVDKDGNIIRPGTPDSKGVTQAKVVPVELPGLFDDPDVVKITPPGEETIEIELPDGVKAKDVDQVVIVSPEITVVTVKDSSPVTGKDVDDLLKKYGE